MFLHDLSILSSNIVDLTESPAPVVTTVIMDQISRQLLPSKELYFRLTLRKTTHSTDNSTKTGAHPAVILYPRENGYSHVHMMTRAPESKRLPSSGVDDKC